jgi:hypothetical protein
VNFEHKAVTAEDMCGWSIVTEGPRAYLVEIANPADEHVGVARAYPRAYLYIEQIDLERGQCIRLVLPIGLLGSEPCLTLVASSERDMTGWDEKDRELFAQLVNDAEKTRANIRSDARISVERPAGLVDPRGKQARS